MHEETNKESKYKPMRGHGRERSKSSKVTTQTGRTVPKTGQGGQQKMSNYHEATERTREEQGIAPTGTITHAPTGCPPLGMARENTI